MKRRTLLVLGLAFVLAVAAACSGGGEQAPASAGGGGGTPETEATPPEPPPETEAADPVQEVLNQETEIVIYDTTGESVELLKEKYGNKLEEKFPNYDFIIIQKENDQTITNLIASGISIDIVVESTARFLQSTELHGSIEDLIEKYDYDLSRLEPTTLEFQKQLIDGGIYGLPSWTRSMVLFYNKDLFDRFGMDYPTEMTWDELYELAKTMTRTEDDVDYKGLTMAFDFVLFLNQFETPFVDPEAQKAIFTSDAFTELFESIARFYRIPGNELPGGKYYLNNQQDPFYKSQTAAMHITLTGNEKIYGDAVNWDIAPLPVPEGESGLGSQSYPTFFFITKTSKHRDAAFQVISYITSDEFQEYIVESGAITILKDQSIMGKFASGNPLYEGKNVEALIPERYANPTPMPLIFWEARGSLLPAMEKATTGTDTNTALREAEEEANKKIEELLMK